MPITYRLILIVALLSRYAYGQEPDSKAETEFLLNSIYQQQLISKNIFRYPFNITDYEFDGDYSTKRLYPNLVTNDSIGNGTLFFICTSPIMFQSPISSVLKTVDPNYDSTYYIEQIKNAATTSWVERNLNLQAKVKFIKWKWRILHHETNMFSTPIFSKDKSVAMIKFGSINRSSMTEKMDRIWIFKRENNNWQLVQTIWSIKTN